MKTQEEVEVILRRYEEALSQAITDDEIVKFQTVVETLRMVLEP